MCNRGMVGTGAMLLLLSALGGGAAASDIADAVMKGDRAAVRALLAQQADVNTPQADGATALHWAVYRDDEETADLLIRAGANVQAANRAGMTALFLACINGSSAMIERLLDAGADPNERLSQGETALMMAARTGAVDAIGVLLDRGAHVNATEDLRGTTALMWAAANEHPAAVEMLVRRGADVGARSRTVAVGRGPYLAPTARSRIEEARLGIGQAGRVSAAVSVDDVSGPARAPADEPPETDPDARSRPPDGGRAQGEVVGEADRPLSGGLTALVFAARQGNLEPARILLEAGADVNQVTEYGWTPLLTATQNRHYRLATFLLDQGADPNIANKGGWTPLYIATDNRNIEGGDYPTRQPDMDHLELIETLLARGADPNARMRSSTETRTIFTHQWLYENGATPFLRAAQSGDITLMRLLLDHGADPSIATFNGTTPLMVASGIGWVEGVTHEWSEAQTLEAVNLLLALGADVNAVDDDGRTALHGAAHKGNTEVVRILADHGADLAARDFGSRDSIHALEGVTWQAIDYADGLVRVGVQSAVAHPETAALLRRLMIDAGLPVPPEDRTLDSICITAACR